MKRFTYFFLTAALTTIFMSAKAQETTVTNRYGMKLESKADGS